MDRDDRRVIDRLEEFLPFLRVVEEMEPSVGESLSRKSDDPEVDFTIRGVRYPDQVHELSRVLRESDWMHPDYLETDVSGYREHPERIAHASLPTLQRLLTAFERGERINPGFRAGVLDRGFVRRIVERLVELREMG